MKKKILVYTDGCYDLFHFGHYNGIKQARLFGTHLLSGINDEESVKRHKNTLIYTNEERLEILSGMRCIDFIIKDAPYELNYPLMLDFGVDIVTHGDDLILNEEGVDIYEEARKNGKFRVFKRTLGISTTEIVGRLLLRTGNFEQHSHDRVEYLKYLEDFFKTPIKENLHSKFSPIPAFFASESKTIDFQKEIENSNALGGKKKENLKKLKEGDFLWLKNSIRSRNGTFLQKIEMSSVSDLHMSDQIIITRRSNLKEKIIISEVGSTKNKKKDKEQSYESQGESSNDPQQEISEKGEVHFLCQKNIDAFSKQYEKVFSDNSSQDYDLFINKDRIVYIDGSFDLYHAGHAALIKEAGLRGDRLILGLFSDRTIKKYTGEDPILTHTERKLILLGNRYVDTILEDPPYVLDVDFVKNHKITEIVCQKDRFKLYEHLKKHIQIYICETIFDHLNVDVIGDRILKNYREYSKKINKLNIS